MRPLPASFYERPVLRLARALLGRRLVRIVRERGATVRLSARIVETEAYSGCFDPASHSFRGLTPRCATMFGPAGRLYVYFTYGAHFCANVVGGSRRHAAAVLLRAAEPDPEVRGLEAMRRGRLARTRAGATADALARGELDRWLARGPGNLAAAFRLDRADDGTDLTSGETIWIERGTAPRRVLWTPRIGLGDNRAGPWLWRCFDAESDAVTRVPASWPRSPRPTPTLVEVRRIARSSRFAERPRSRASAPLEQQRLHAR
jgi:DNA-3-methyladenine glycosylase